MASSFSKVWSNSADVRPNLLASPPLSAHLHVELLGGLGDDLQFVELFDDDEDAFAHLLGQQRQFNIALVLVSVAHDERVALALYGDDGMQFGLRSGLQSEVELASVADDLFHHRLHLVHLDGVDDEVLPLVVVFLLGLLKATGRLLDAVVEDVGEAQQHGRGHIAQRQFVHHVAQVYLRVVFTRRHKDITFLVDTKVRGSPSVDVVKFLGVFYCPLLHLRYFYSIANSCFKLATENFIFS